MFSQFSRFFTFDPQKFILNKIVVLLAAVALIGCGASQPRIEAEPIRWRKLSEGKAEASSLGMPSYVDFYYGKGCERCMLLDRKIYEDRMIVSRLNAFFIPIRIDLKETLSTEETALMEELGNKEECVFGFLHSNGLVMRDSEGMKISEMGSASPKKFMQILDAAISADSKISRSN